MTDHERIWLEPEPASDPDYGRQWVQHNVWPDGVEYIRADLALRSTIPTADSRVTEPEGNVVRRDVYEAMLDSQYRAGAQAGWNAAQLPEPEAAAKIAQLIKVEAGDLAALRRPKQQSSAHRIAEALELCDWSGCSIGNKEILKAAVAALRQEGN